MSGFNQMRMPEIVCILGMHRSGTSVFTRILNLIGLYLGPEQQLLQPNDYNPKGYWEHDEIVSLNNEILERLGGSWDEPPAFPPGWENAPAMDDLKQRAQRLIQDSFADVQTWGWKDPRSCLTLPFWQQLLPDMRYVVCLRNPVDVALSLEQRDRLSAEKSSRLWLTYVSSALKHSDGRPRLVVFYEDLMEDCLGALQRLAGFLGKPERAEQADVQEAVQAFIEKGLQHYRASLVQATASPRIDRRARALYIAQRISVSLGREIDGQDGIDGQIEKALELLRYSFKASDQAGPLQEQLAERDGQLAENRHTIRALEARLKEKDAALQRMESQAADLGARLNEKDAALERMESQAADREQKIGMLSARVLDSETQLRRIGATAAWRLLTQCSRIKHRYLMPVYRLFGRVPAEPESKPTDN